MTSKEGNELVPVIQDRGITVGKSWPRPATPCDLVPRWEGEFVSHSDWVNFASKRLTVAYDSNGSELKAICVDTLGRRCANGRDFKRADDEGTFPVRYFWDCEAPRTSSTAELLEALENLTANIVEAFPALAPLGPITAAQAAIARAKGGEA